MGIVELLVIAVAVSMDAFAVSICKGLSVPVLQPVHVLKTALWFGGFQALMPLVGYFIGDSFTGFVTNVDHWIAWLLLCAIGANMIRESFHRDECCTSSSDFSFRTMLAMAVATSIDALAVGVTFAFLEVAVCYAVLVIGVTTAVFSAVGIMLGNLFGNRYKSRAEFAGGMILMMMGFRILMEHFWS